MERPLFMPGSLGLQAEFYQCALAAVYHGDGLWGDATFDLYARGLPPGWGYLVAAGLDPLQSWLQSWRFSDDDIAFLRDNPYFARVDPSFFEQLKRTTFEGDMWAVPEGTVVFPGEPILRITAPLIVCTLIETRAIQLISAATGVATRAARMVDAANGAHVVDFGSRRSPGPEAALMAARSAYVGGVSATTNALASARYGITPMGTLSDTFLAAYGDDRLAIDAYRLHFPDLCHLTLPDDDPIEGLRRYLPFRDEIHTVRVDTDHLLEQSRRVRQWLDANDMKHVRILGSAHLDELRIHALARAGAPIQLYAIGRALAAGADVDMRMAFRIAERSNGPTSVPVRHAGAAPYPGRKQIMRFDTGDQLCLEHEVWAAERIGGVPLLQHVLREGDRLTASPPLHDARQRRARQVSALPDRVRHLYEPEIWPVSISDGLAQLAIGGR